MKYKDAMEQAIAIQKEYPERIIAGSLSLILFNIMEVREVNDIDMITKEAPSDYFCHSAKTSPNYYKDTRHVYHTPYTHDLYIDANIPAFTMNTDYRVPGKEKRTIQVQDPFVTMYHKLKLKRDKDFIDLTPFLLKLIESKINRYKNYNFNSNEITT